MSLNELKETALIKRCKNGDTLAFRDLINAYKDVSLNLAYSVLKDESIAEDVVQTSFIKVYQKINTFQETAKFSTWLYRIVINTSYNALKQQKKYLKINELPELSNIETNEKANDIILKQDDQKKYILLAMNAIKADEALVLKLFYLYEYTIIEIQEITGFSKAKIKVDLHRGRLNMESKLKKLLGNEVKYLL